MKTVKDRRNLYAVLSVILIFLTAMLFTMHKMSAAIHCGGLTVMVLILLYRQNLLLSVARVIYDSRILTVPSAIIISDNRSNKKQADETIVSTFGLLLGNKVYKWGCEGVHGIRLHKVQIDREHICLSFGDYSETISIVLLHNLTDRKSVMEIVNKIWRETGVKTEVCDWY